MNFSLPASVRSELQKTTTQSEVERVITDFCILLDKWNQKISLTSARTPELIATEHVLDSILAARILPESEAFLDIGSGAGFPGLVLAMLWPNREAHLVEPKEKSSTFLKEAVKNLKLQNVTVHTIPIEELQGDEIVPIYQEHFSISRAFSPMRKFFGYCSYLVKDESPLYLMTGEDSEALDNSAIAKHELAIIKTTSYDSSKPKKLLVEIGRLS
jgi:16S rRNA (guanine527-N7)-methyltransferase